MIEKLDISKYDAVLVCNLNDHINEDYTELEAWEEKIERWDKGHSFGADNVSLFFEGEKEIALNSINNK